MKEKKWGKNPRSFETVPVSSSTEQASTISPWKGAKQKEQRGREFQRRNAAVLGRKAGLKRKGGGSKNKMAGNETRAREDTRMRKEKRCVRFSGWLRPKPLELWT